MDNRELIRLMKIFLLAVCVILCAATAAAGVTAAAERSKPAALAAAPLQIKQEIEEVVRAFVSKLLPPEN